jgi:hypothetical protein
MAPIHLDHHLIDLEGKTGFLMNNKRYKLFIVEANLDSVLRETPELTTYEPIIVDLYIGIDTLIHSESTNIFKKPTSL